MLHRFIAVALAALVAAGMAGVPLAFADDPGGGETTGERSEVVVVTAILDEEPVDEAPAAVTVLDGEALRRQGLHSLADALRQVPGVTLVRTGSPGKASSLFVRGMASTQTLILYDGVELNTPFFGSYDLAHLSLSDVERIEVVRGPFSALYGSQAIGGVVNVVTRTPRDQGVSGTLRLEAGNDDHRFGDFAVTAAAGRFRFTATLDRLETANLEGETVDLGGDLRLENDDYQRTTRSARAAMMLPGGGEVAVQLRDTDAELGIPYSGFTPTPRARQDVDETVLAVPVRLSTGPAGDLALLVSRVDQDFAFRDPDGSFSAQDTAVRLDTYRAVQSLRELGGHRLFAGFEREDQRVDNSSVFFGFGSENLSSEEASTTSWFVQDVWEIREGLRLTAGLRRDDFDGFGAEWSPRVAVRYTFDEGTTVLRGAWGEAFRSPSVGERAFPFSGNPELRPEISESFEVGVVQYLVGERVRLEGTLFHNDLDDLIQFDFATLINQNIGRVRTRGAELSVAAAVAGALEVGADYTYLDAEDRDAPADEAALLRRPEGQARLWVSWNPARPLSLHAEALWLDDRPDVDPVTFERSLAGSYAVVDVSAVWRLSRRLDLRGRIGNLLDEDYEEALGFPARGRHAGLGLAARF